MTGILLAESGQLEACLIEFGHPEASTQECDGLRGPGLLGSCVLEFGQPDLILKIWMANTTHNGIWLTGTLPAYFWISDS